MTIKLRNLLVSVAIIAVAAVATANADELVYWTNLSANTINQYDVTTSVNTVIDNTPPGIGNPDSLIFSGANIVYSEFTRNCCSGTAGSVRTLSPGKLGGTDSQVATGFTHEAVDLSLDPAGLGFAHPTVLLSDRNDEAGGAGFIQRIDLVTGASTQLAALTYVDGTAYKGLALYANAGAIGSQKVVQINPLTGAIINAGDPNFNASFLDGLTYDPVSNLLYAANGGCMQTFNPTTLMAGACVGSFANIDGLESDGKGNILVADVGAGVVGIYNIAAGTSNTLFSAPGLDDIAPVAGLGAPTPEPGTLVMFGSGAIGLACLIRRKFSV